MTIIKKIMCDGCNMEIQGHSKVFFTIMHRFFHIEEDWDFCCRDCLVKFVNHKINKSTIPD